MRNLKRLNECAIELTKNKYFNELFIDFIEHSLNELVLTNSIREIGTQDEVIARQVFKRYFENLLDYGNIANDERSQ